MTFGEKVKAERTKLCMSQDELAAKIGDKDGILQRRNFGETALSRNNAVE